MTVERIAGVGVWIVIASAGVMGQQRDDRNVTRPEAPAESVIERTYPLGGVLPSRSVETRSDSGGRAVVTETIETPNLDDKLAPTREVITETIASEPNTVQTKRDVFGFLAPGQRMLFETTRSKRETLPDGTTRAAVNILAPDVNGRPGLTFEQIQHTKSISPDVKQADTAVFRPGIDGPLRESERLQQTERQVQPDVTRNDRTLSVRDANGRFPTTETSSRVVRTTGPSESVEEETIQRLDVNGRLTVSERNVTRHIQANGQNQVITETFSRNVAGLVSGNRLELSQRVRRTTTSNADKGGQTVEEVEARVPGFPNEPLRVVRRTVETTRRVNTEQSQTERHVYLLDENGRLALAIDETGEVTEK